MGWTPDQACRVEGDYKRFLYALAHKRPDDILSPPTQEVDEFWHQHILDTRKYREDCETVFGHYVDHTPGLDQEMQRRADQRRQEVYAQYGIDSISFDSYGGRPTRRDRGFGDSAGSDFSDGDSGSGHSAHSHHDSGSSHGGDSGAHGCDSAGHGDSGSCDSGGGDGGGGDGGGCGGGGCGGG
jgi:hypothetical protein